MKLHVGAALLAATLLSLPLGAQAAQDPTLTSWAWARSAIYSHNTNTFYPGGYSQPYSSEGQPVGASAGSGTVTEGAFFYDPGCPCSVPITWKAETSATGSASASFGSLHATASAAYQLLPLTQTLEGYTAQGEPFSKTLLSPFYLRATGFASAQLTDYFTVTSSLLPLGATVYADVSTQVDATLTGGGSIDVDVYAYDLSNYDGVPGVDFRQTDPGTISTTARGRLALVVGDQYELFGGLSVNADTPTGACDATSLYGSVDDYGYALLPGACGGQVVTADAGDTAKLFISPGPDVALTFASGFDYAPPATASGAPEPAEWALMLTGAALAGATLRRRRPTGEAGGRL